MHTFGHNLSGDGMAGWCPTHLVIELSKQDSASALHTMWKAPGQRLAFTRRANDAVEACSHLCNDAVASVLIRSDNDAVASTCRSARTSGKCFELSRDARKCLALARSGMTKGAAPPHLVHTHPVPTEDVRSFVILGVSEESRYPNVRSFVALRMTKGTLG
jgi:hypothetical protein